MPSKSPLAMVRPSGAKATERTAGMGRTTASSSRVVASQMVSCPGSGGNAPAATKCLPSGEVATVAIRPSTGATSGEGVFWKVCRLEGDRRRRRRVDGVGLELQCRHGGPQRQRQHEGHARCEFNCRHAFQNGVGQDECRRRQGRGRSAEDRERPRRGRRHQRRRRGRGSRRRQRAGRQDAGEGDAAAREPLLQELARPGQPAGHGAFSPAELAGGVGPASGLADSRGRTGPGIFPPAAPVPHPGAVAALDRPIPPLALLMTLTTTPGWPASPSPGVGRGSCEQPWRSGRRRRTASFPRPPPCESPPPSAPARGTRPETRPRRLARVPARGDRRSRPCRCGAGRARRTRTHRGARRSAPSSWRSPPAWLVWGSPAKVCWAAALGIRLILRAPTAHHHERGTGGAGTDFFPGMRESSIRQPPFLVETRNSDALADESITLAPPGHHEMRTEKKVA